MPRKSKRAHTVFRDDFNSFNRGAYTVEVSSWGGGVRSSVEGGRFPREEGLDLLWSAGVDCVGVCGGGVDFMSRKGKTFREGA